jgi:hypothetical protein
MRPRYLRRNADERLRRLEREAAADESGQAQLALNAELWRTGKAIPYYAELLLNDFVDDVETFQTERRAAHPLAWQIFDGLVVSPGGSEAHGAQVSAPDSFGRVQGLWLSMQVLNEQANWARASRISFQDRARAEKAGRPFPPSTVIRVCVALSQHPWPPRRLEPGQPYTSPVHPLYFFHRNDKRWAHARSLDDFLRRKLPSRMFCTRILASDLDTRANALAAVGRALAGSFDDLNLRLGWAGAILDRVASEVGTPITAAAARELVRSMPTSRLRQAIEALQAAPGRVIGDQTRFATPRPAVRAWNASGGGVLEAAMVGLVRFLQVSMRAVIQEFRVDAYDQESGWFSRAHMSVTSRRARRTRNPVTFEVDWDAVDGAWRDRGEGWIGNEIPPGGLWKISMVNSPATAQEMARPAEQWIRDAFPGARIEVAAWWEPGTTRPAYRPST